MSNKQRYFKFVLDPTTDAVLEILTHHLAISRADVIRQALRRFAQAEGIKIPVITAGSPSGGVARSRRRGRPARPQARGAGEADA